MAQRRAVYTALLGRYEQLGEQPVARESEVPFICFTDQPDLVSETWTIVQVTPAFPFDLVRSQRDLKIRGQAALTDFDETLYIDNSVLLERRPEDILDEWLAEADFSVSLHSFRDRVIDEFDEIVRLNYDDASRVHEQLLHYAELYPDVLYERPTWNGLMARRNTPEVRQTMAIWFDHVLRYSRRDQLSANVAFALGGVDVNRIEQDNTLSPMHRWPVDVKRNTALSIKQPNRTGPLLAEVARLERQLSEAVVLAEEQGLRLEVLETDLADTRDRLSRSDYRVEQLNAELATLFESTSWKISRPLRAVGSGVRKLRKGGQTD